MTDYKNWDSDQRTQLHLELHALGILEDLLESDRLPPLEEFEQVKFHKLAPHNPPPPNKPDYSEVKMITKSLSTGMTWEEPAPGEHEKYVKEWKRWIIPPMLKKLKSTVREIKEIEEKLSGSYNELLFEKLRYKRRLKELIEKWCFNRFSRVPIMDLHIGGIRRKDLYPHLDPHKRDNFPHLVKRLFDEGRIPVHDVYPDKKEPEDPEETKHLKNAFKHAVWRHRRHKENKGKFEIVIMTERGDTPTSKIPVFVYRKKLAETFGLPIASEVHSS